MSKSTLSDSIKLSLSERMRHYSTSLKASRISAALARIGITNSQSIHSYTAPSELRALYELASNVPDGGTIVEVGSYLGAATCYLLAGGSQRDVQVVAVDTWGNETMPDGERDTYVEFCTNVGAPRDDLRIVRKLSAETSDDDFPDKADLVFIDADHSYESVSKDFSHYQRLASPDCVFAFHDCNSFPGVTRVIGEALATGEWNLMGTVVSLVWIRRADRERVDA